MSHKTLLAIYLFGIVALIIFMAITAIRTPDKFNKYGVRILQFIIGGSAVIGIPALLCLLTYAAYYPLRVYLTGQTQFDIVQEKKEYHYTGYKFRSDGFMVYGLKHEHYYNVGIPEGEQIKIGQRIRVFVSNRIKAGIILREGDTPNYLFVSARIDKNGLGVFIALGVLLFYSWATIKFAYATTKDTLREISFEAKKKLKEEDTIFIKGEILLKEYLPFIVSILFSYYFSYKVIKGVLTYEGESVILTTVILFGGILVVIFGPLFLSLMRLEIRNTKKVWIKNTVSIISILIILFGIYSMAIDREKNLIQAVVDLVDKNTDS